MRKIWIVMCFLAPLGVVAQTIMPQPAPPQIPLVIELQEADEFRALISSMGDGPIKTLMIAFYNRLQLRQQARQVESMKTTKDGAPPLPPTGN